MNDKYSGESRNKSEITRKDTVRTIPFMSGMVHVYYLEYSGGGTAWEYGIDWWGSFNHPLLVPMSELGIGDENTAIQLGCEHIVKHVYGDDFMNEIKAP